MLLTQPFLLYLVLRGNGIKHPKKSWFEKLGEICVDAARNAAMVLKEMRAEGSLSSLVTIDCTCALKIIMIFILVIAREEVEGAVGKGRAREARELIQGVVDVLDGMEQVGFVKSVVGELPQRLERLGIKREVEDRPVQESLAQSWAGFDSWVLFNIGNMNYSNTETEITLTECHRRTCKV